MVKELQKTVYADLLLDTAFKRSFKEYGDAKRLMLLFLQALIPERKIASIEYTPEESTNQNPDRKSIRVDVECVDENGQRFVVEVQRAKQEDFFDRAVFNSTFSIQRQLREGAKSFRLAPVYFIGITRFDLHQDPDQFLYHYQLTERRTQKVMTDNLHYIFLEVSKCKNNDSSSFVEKIGFALNNMGSFEKRPEGFAGEFFDLLFNSADIANFAPEDKIKYLNDMTTERDIHNQIEYARKEGIEKGRQEGREEGIEEGRKEERRLIAQKCKEEGMSIEMIIRLSGLTEQEILSL